jgi:hypothetical protein
LGKGGGRGVRASAVHLTRINPPDPLARTSIRAAHIIPDKMRRACVRSEEIGRQIDRQTDRQTDMGKGLFMTQEYLTSFQREYRQVK